MGRASPPGQSSRPVRYVTTHTQCGCSGYRGRADLPTRAPLLGGAGGGAADNGLCTYPDPSPGRMYGLQKRRRGCSNACGTWSASLHCPPWSAPGRDYRQPPADMRLSRGRRRRNPLPEPQQGPHCRSREPARCLISGSGLRASQSSACHGMAGRTHVGPDHPILSVVDWRLVCAQLIGLGDEGEEDGIGKGLGWERAWVLVAPGLPSRPPPWKPRGSGLGWRGV